MMVTDYLLLQKIRIIGSILKREKKRGREKRKLFLIVKCQLTNDNCSGGEEDRKSSFDNHLGSLGQDDLVNAKQGSGGLSKYRIFISFEYLAIKYLPVTEINLVTLEWRKLTESNLTAWVRVWHHLGLT